jgi:hypothetical protein
MNPRSCKDADYEPDENRREPTHALQRDGKSLSLDQPPGSLLYRHLAFQLSLSNWAFWISVNFFPLASLANMKKSQKIKTAKLKCFMRLSIAII